MTTNPGVFAYSDYPSMLIEDLRRRAERAEAALAERNTPCVWCDNGGNGIYATTCGKKRERVSPHCPNCGHPVKVK